jgi:hypothetical protein
MLTAENFQRGFLVDEQLMAGVTEDPDQKGRYVAFVLRPETGEYLGYQAYPELPLALEAINRIPRSWSYEKTSSNCGDGNCGTDGGCRGGGVCGRNAATEPCPEVCGH